jgi:hypothetical protein
MIDFKLSLDGRKREDESEEVQRWLEEVELIMKASIDWPAWQQSLSMSVLGKCEELERANTE